MQTNIQHTPTRDHAAAVPLGDFDVVEDGNTLVNRLYYAVPNCEDGKFSCSFFYEENTFCKDANGDLILVHSEMGTADPLESE